MKPNDHFSFLKNNQVSQDTRTLLRFYAPILGKEATSLYLYCLAFWDNGQDVYTLGHILNHLDMGMDSLKKALERLTALGLLDLYQDQSGYLFKLYPSLSAEDFLAHHVYRRLLEKRIGEAALLAMEQPDPKGQKLSKKLSEIFDEAEVPLANSSSQKDFDLTRFKQLMARDQLRFSEEKEDLLSLFAISEQQNWTWYETYLLAKETAINHLISPKRMRNKLAQERLEEEFSKQEKVIIQEAKRKSPPLFLAEVKSTLEATITSGERKILADMQALGLLDEVINIIVLYSLNRDGSATLKQGLTLTVANDFAHKKIHTAEEAVLKIRERRQAQKQAQEKKAQPESNIPTWSKPDYKNETSPEQQSELEAEKRRLLAKLEGGD
ncbi:DnaD domain protein [Streptococcus oricebi]|uniref:DNA helicase n=1 Tax=Streptococcus oricebi TaxID=1547447 RepID=A0ABS5B1W3_9STRE|nr:DnaD domain protein [Streptococcus oricebi]MBP2622823.1 DNA helicase [Streptococcus oricebi]